MPCRDASAPAVPDADLRQQLEHSERLRSMGEMAAAQAHYMNNVLGTLVSQIEVMRLNPADAETVREFTDSMLETCRKAAVATRTLSEFARPARPDELADLDLNRIAAEAVQILEPMAREQQRNRKLAVQIEFRPGSPPPVRARPSEVRQIIINLVRNSLEAVTASGVVTVATEADGDGRACLTVTDAGPGVPAELRDEIWRPFFTTKPSPALGLGLSVARALAQRMGGRIDLRPSERGAVFAVTLPGRLAAG